MIVMMISPRPKSPVAGVPTSGRIRILVSVKLMHAGPLTHGGSHGT
jgi:hypothetical protein